MKSTFELEVPAAKLAFGRFVVFALLAADALSQIRHAPRYGSGFNVAQLPGLDALGPGRVSYGLCELVLAYAFVLIACGVATRWLVPIAAVIYNWLYFGSQLDSYQHHYLVAMLLIVACFVPWQRPSDGNGALDQPVKSWALRLILVELAIVYLWAAISKIDPLWLNGSALSAQLHGSLRGLIDATIGMHAVAILVPLTELALVLVWARPAWAYLAPLGILFHLGIVWTGLEIGLFAWLMIALYLFVVPDRVYVVAVRVLAPVRTTMTALARMLERRRWIVLAAAVLVGLACASVCRLPGAHLVAVVATVCVIAAGWRSKRLVALAVAHVLALGMWLAIDRTTPIARDYYKFWGGTARRLNDPGTAETAYRHLTEVAPDDASAHFYLGKLLLAHDDTTGLDELHASQRLDRAHARGYIAEAQWLAAHDRLAEAVTAAQAGAAAEPNNAEARSLVTTLIARSHGR
ncbi:MAG: HTTM domain-containing protein [Deltaproteobacteria bacterium]